MTENKAEHNPENTNGTREKLIKWGLFAVALIVAFLIGFIPMWMKANDYAAEHEVTRKTLARSEISNLITTAIVNARRGEYEAARQSASDFYTRLDAEINKGETSAYPTAQNENLKRVFENRDEIITLLARRDPASVERLTDIYLAYRQAIGAATATENVQTPANTGVSTNSP